MPKKVTKKRYRIGEGWKKSFDYCGMLKAGQTLKPSDSIKKMEKILASYTSVNYHTVATPLSDAIDLFKEAKSLSYPEAVKEIRKFNRLSKTTFQKHHCHI